MQGWNVADYTARIAALIEVVGLMPITAFCRFRQNKPVIDDGRANRGHSSLAPRRSMR
jgi:hypothetical protein